MSRDNEVKRNIEVCRVSIVMWKSKGLLRSLVAKENTTFIGLVGFGGFRGFT